MLCHKNTPPGSNDPDTLTLKENLDTHFKNKHFVLCQIGANDGISADPIYDYIFKNNNVEAHLVEPQADAFKLLVENYDTIKNENRVYFYNYAVSNTNKDIKLYKNIAVNGTDGHSSLLVRDLDVHNDIVVANYNDENYEIVKSITVNKLNENINKNIDVLVIDVEGYDTEIVKFFLEEKIFPKIIYFERPGITGIIPDNDILTGNSASEFIINKLEKNNYTINKLNDNWLCVKN